MSDLPPYNSGNPYVPSTQYQPPQSGYYPPDQPPQYSYPQPAYQQQVYAPQPQYVGVAVQVGPIDEPGYGPALTGMVLGIISIFFPIVGLVGIFFSIAGLKSVTRKGMAIAGLITSIIGILEIVLTVAIIVIAVAAAAASSTYPTY